MNDISKVQNEPDQLLLLAAQRHLYSRAKTTFAIHVTVAGPIPVALALVAQVYAPLKIFAASWGVAITLLDVFAFTPLVKRLRDQAAVIQEEFDCRVFQLPWNDLKAGKHPDPGLVKEQSEAFYRRSPGHQLLDWYPPVVSSVSSSIGRVICQRLNCYWDGKLRRKYAAAVVILVLAVLGALTFLSLGRSLSLDDFLSHVAFPLLPAIVLGVRQFTEQRDAANRLDVLRDHADRLRIETAGSHDEDKALQDSRSLQDEILDNRRRGPIIFDWIYKLLRRRYQGQINFSAEQYVEEAGVGSSGGSVGG